MGNNVWSFSEDENVAGEVATAAGEAAKAIGGEAYEVEVGGSRGGARAGKRLLLKGSVSSEASPELVSEAIFRAAKSFEPVAILVGATRNGRETASRLAAKLGAGTLSEAVRLSVDGRMLVAERSAYAGKVVAKVGAPFPCVATVKVGSYARSAPGQNEVVEFSTGEITGKTKTLNVSKKEAGAVDLRSAKIIVSAGRGVKRKEDLGMLQSLADEMGGALGCSRPLSSDLGWLPEEHHIGLTGVTVKPDLYLAVGISGQLQHIAGMKDSRVVAAVNTDKDAPIFQAADYGIVGDLYQVVPALQKALQSSG